MRTDALCGAGDAEEPVLLPLQELPAGEWRADARLGHLRLRSFPHPEGPDYALHRSSPPVERGFCAACGTALTYRHAERPGDIDVTLTRLDEPGRFEPECHIWVEDRLPWMRIGDGRPQYARWRG